MSTVNFATAPDQRAESWVQELSNATGTNVSTYQENGVQIFVVQYDCATLPDIMYWAKILAEIADKRVYFTAEAIKINVSKETNLEALVQKFQAALLSQGGISEIGPAED